MVMDWREMVGRPTVRGIYDAERWGSYLYSWAWSGGKIVGFSWREDLLRMELGTEGIVDPRRGWVIAFGWVAACCVEYVLHHLGNMINDGISQPNSSLYSYTKTSYDPGLFAHAAL